MPDEATRPDNRQDAKAEAIKRMREASGHVTDDRPLVSFLYLLTRDHLPVGTVETMLDDCRPLRSTFTNGWLATWAKDAAGRLQEQADVSGGVNG